VTTLLQISDPHFGTEQPTVMRALRRLAHHAAPDLVVLSGDITQRARGAQFRAARQFIDELAVPACLAIPGNHDIPLYDIATRLLAPYTQYLRAFGPDLEPAFETEHLLVLGVNTTRAYRHKHGEVSQSQIARVAARLRAVSATKLRLVIVHQPVFAIRDSDEQNLLRGHREAVPAWAAAGADIIMGGHIHLPYVRSLRDAFPALSREVWTVQAGTAISSRIRDEIPNSVNMLHFAGATLIRECGVERWDYNAASSSFELHTRQVLPLALS